MPCLVAFPYHGQTKSYNLLMEELSVKLHELAEEEVRLSHHVSGLDTSTTMISLQTKEGKNIMTFYHWSRRQTKKCSNSNDKRT